MTPTAPEKDRFDGPPSTVPIRRYPCALITPGLGLMVVVLVVSLTGLITSPFWSQSRFVQILLIFVATGSLYRIAAHIANTPIRLELHDDHYTVSYPFNQLRLRYDRIERIHYDRTKEQLRIEKKSGAIVRLCHINHPVSRIVARLEAKVYGRPVDF